MPANRDEFFAKLAPLDAEQRVTFRRLATEAQSALHATDSGPAEEAMELMIDLACHADGGFRSDDPQEAAKFVVSQACRRWGRRCWTPAAPSSRRGRCRS